MTILILLQSCSGGTIGDFLDSSFKNIEEPKIKNDSISTVAPFRIINIGNQNKILLKDFINAIEKALNMKAKIAVIPMKTVRPINTFFI